MTDDQTYRPANDVVEACADALLTAVAAALAAAGDQPSIAQCLTEARLVLEHIARRTLREGDRPR